MIVLVKTFDYYAQLTMQTPGKIFYEVFVELNSWKFDQNASKSYETG